MPVYPTSFALSLGLNPGFVDVTVDTLSAQCQYGIQGSGPEDRVASTGTMEFDLDNSEYNSAAKLGYYSPNHANVRSGFDLGIKVRFAITYGGTTYYKFRGTLDEITPITGIKRTRRTQCTAVDWMDQAATTNVRGVATQVNKRDDQLITTLLAVVTAQPAATSISTGIDTFSYGLDNTQSETTAILSEFQKIAKSAFSYIYIKGDTTQGETFVYEPRNVRAAKTTALTTLNNTMHGMVITRRRADIYNRVQVTWHPRVIGATSVIFTLASTNQAIALDPLGTMTLLCPYTDPTLRDVRIGATNVIAPVATTDYMMNSASDGSGTNLTTSLSVTATIGGDAAMLVLTNNSTTTTGYLVDLTGVPKLQIRGDPVRDQQEAIADHRDSTSATSYGERVLAFDCSYQSVPGNADALSAYLLSVYKSPVSFVTSVSFVANDSDALMTAALVREPGDRIALVETVSGISTTTAYYINHVELSIEQSRIVHCTWTLAPATHQAFWLIGTAGASEIGQTTNVGF